MCRGRGWVIDPGLTLPVVGGAVFLLVFAGLVGLSFAVHGWRFVEHLRPNFTLLLIAAPVVGVVWLYFVVCIMVAIVTGRIRVRCTECWGGNGEPEEE